MMRSVESEIRQGDCLDLMRAMPDACVDAIVTDPPYGERAAAWDYPRDFAWHKAWMLEANRVLRPGAPLVTFAGRRCADVVMGALRSVRGDESACPLQTGVWAHRQGFPVAKGILRPEHEPWMASGLLRVDADDVRAARSYSRERAAFMRKKPGRFRCVEYVPHSVGPMGGTVFNGARNAEERTGHPTQKPVAIMAYLVALACAPGSLVLDPFAGSGTVGVVAVCSGRSFIGLELNEKYCRTARRRIYRARQ